MSSGHKGYVFSRRNFCINSLKQMWCWCWGGLKGRVRLTMLQTPYSQNKPIKINIRRENTNMSNNDANIARFLAPQVSIQGYPFSQSTSPGQKNPCYKSILQLWQINVTTINCDRSCADFYLILMLQQAPVQQEHSKSIATAYNKDDLSIK